MDHSATLAQAPQVPTGMPPAPAGLGMRRPGRVYLWRRAIVLAALACLLWGALWGVFQIGGLVGARLVAPAVGTAPVPVVDGAQGDS